jgi:hypothetical protein
MHRLFLVLILAGCAPPAATTQDRAADPTPTATPIPERQVPPPTFAPAAARLVGIGDVHGDLTAAQDALRIAGAIDGDDAWIGGDLVVVQTGDQLDRGDQEEAILELFERLAIEAHAAGGAFYSLLGNHEMMNVELDLRYVTAGGFDDFADTQFEDDAELISYPLAERGRVAAFRPGGEWARVFSEHNTMMVVGDTAFVHGGILPAHVDYGLERANDEVRAWMRGEGAEPNAVIGGDGPVWRRDFSDATGPAECAALEEALAAIPAARMVVGHTVQGSVTSACDEQVWRVDVGMAAYYGGPRQVVLIEDGEVTVLD